MYSFHLFILSLISDTIFRFISTTGVLLFHRLIVASSYIFCVISLWFFYFWAFVIVQFLFRRTYFCSDNLVLFISCHISLVIYAVFAFSVLSLLSDSLIGIIRIFIYDGHFLFNSSLIFNSSSFIFRCFKTKLIYWIFC